MAIMHGGTNELDGARPRAGVIETDSASDAAAAVVAACAVVETAPAPAKKWMSPRARAIVIAWAGACLGIGALGLSATASGWPLLLGSFGASCTLLFAYPEAAFSRARNVIGGHVLSSAVGVVFLHLFGPSWWAMALAAGTAIALMMATDTVHPPAGSNAVIIFTTQAGWSFVLAPTAVGAIALVIGASAYNRWTREATSETVATVAQEA
jgi:CBS-domain-containing membrane protein